MIYNAYADKRKEVSGIEIVSCGHIFAKPEREIYRPSGRDDWLFFYVASESECFYLNSTEIATPGSFIIYAPHEKQHHIYKGSKTAEFYFVHFKCDRLPDGISLKTSTLYHTRFNRSICDTLEGIIDETLNKQPLYQNLSVYKLLHALTQLERDVLCINHPEGEKFERIARVIQHINKSYNGNFTLKDYADMSAMSKYHFLRLFEKIVGSTPIEYRNNIRLQHAVDLLLEEKLSVDEIGSIVGYSSASYFSSAFKKKFGVSPKQYKSERL